MCGGGGALLHSLISDLPVSPHTLSLRESVRACTPRRRQCYLHEPRCASVAPIFPCCLFLINSLLAPFLRALQPQPPLLTDAAAAAPRTHTYIHTVLVSQQQEKRAPCRHPPLNRAEVRGGDVAALFSWQQTCERSRRGTIAGFVCVRSDAAADHAQMLARVPLVEAVRAPPHGEALQARRRVDERADAVVRDGAAPAEVEVCQRASKTREIRWKTSSNCAQNWTITIRKSQPSLLLLREIKWMSLLLLKIWNVFVMLIPKFPYSRYPQFSRKD